MLRRTLTVASLALLAACGTVPAPTETPAAGHDLLPGFKLGVFADGLGRARFMTCGGTIFRVTYSK